VKKIVFTCLQDGHIEVSKVTSKDSITRKKKCPKCDKPMNFIRKNKKKYKNLAKKGL
tara:strand:+ start:11447 stop:11617 length:171 start_codon:yes stop_codon:yes gene_type:complete